MNLMPELPEVETIRRVLERKIAGRTIQCASLRVPKLAASRLTRDLRPQAASLLRRLRGRKILGLRRRAKYLILDLDAGRLVVHLGMTGQLFARVPGEKPCCDLPALPDKHTHLILELSGRVRVYYRDIRKFGRLRFLKPGEEEAFFRHLGLEPFSRGFTPWTLDAGLHGKKASVKALLLNQHVVAGLGNIYVDEVLFRSRIAPQTPGGRLTSERIRRLHAAIREVLREAIRFRGTTLSDYFDPESRRGAFQFRLKVYGREGEPCPVCGRPIIKNVVAQRGTHWCRHCQR
jgi:formamidopyrimidine-DNA glycosylase